MDVVVTCAIALAVLSVVLLVPGARALVAALRGLKSAASQTAERLKPLSEELQAEAAVAAVEIENLQRSGQRDKRGGP
ncbi:MAG TPA: hypothetical protein VML96_13670 [Egibacteraceae bacterium]|nr:hypothetical protein [Egibacteraceae bacterium]